MTTPTTPSTHLSRAEVMRRLDKHIEDLPVLPTVLVDLLRLHPTDQSYFEKVASIVAGDPTFAARIVGAANSAESSPASPILRIPDAVARLGATRVSGLVTAMSVARVFVPRSRWELGLWQHALGVATTAEFLARASSTTVDVQQAYLGGLLHDLGRFILFKEAPEALRRVDETKWDSPADLIAAEASICGFTHCEIGAQAATRWNLPTAISDLCRRHHEVIPVSANSKEDRVLRVVHVADWLAMAIERMPEGQIDDPTACLDTFAGIKGANDLRIDTSTIPRMMGRIASASREAANHVGLGAFK